MKKKNVLALVAISITVMTIFAPLIPTVTAITDPTSWYMTVPGVLDSDYYSLYPFEEKSLDVGFSKFGELVNPNVPTASIGLDYDGRDPFANEGIPKAYWLQGWFADVRYVHRVYGARRVWAFATFADLVDFGGDWINGATDPYLAPHGGRKTNGAALSEPITVLYDGPRRFVAICKTHLNDTILGSTFPLLDVTFTIIYEKVKKEVIILKDIKLTIDQKILETPVDVQFSNRGEWDLGPDPDWKSYGHFYHQELETCYGAEWTLAKTILREYHFSTLTFSGTTLDLDAVTDSESDFPYYDVPVAWRSEYVYVNGVWQVPGTDYNINYDTGVITFTESKPANTKVEVFWKFHKYDSEGCEGDPIETPHLYDLAQIISRDQKYVGYVAFWPVTSDYSVDAWDKALKTLVNVDDEDMLPLGAEPDIPYVVGEWDFMLDFDPGTTDWGEQFRGVSVYGVTNHHDAKDKQMTGAPANKIDREVKYQLAEVFNPWGLVDAVHKETRSWVEWTSGSSSWTSDRRPVVDVSDEEWDQYCVFSERVIDYTTGALLNRWKGQYNFIVDSNGYAQITGLSPSKTYKILYDTLPNVDDYIALGPTTIFTNEVEDQSSMVIPYIEYDAIWSDNIGVDYEWWMEFDTMTVLTTDSDVNWTRTYTDYFFRNLYDLKVFLGETFATEYFESWTNYPENVTIGSAGSGLATFYWDPDWVETYITATDDPSVIWPLDDETIHVVYLNLYVPVTVRVNNYYNVSTQTSTLNVTITAQLEATWNSKLMGRYEWTTVGRDAATVDSAGAALVTAAFKNKQVEIGMAGADMMNPIIYDQMPWVTNKFTAGNDVADYMDALGRAALRDDWCKAGTKSGDEWPVASSNMIGVGGPIANVLAYYGNDFSNAFFGLDAYAGAAYIGKIISLPCWNKNLKASSDTTGYAVISAYKDINGTVLFLIWGHWGRDTFYACKWFHEEGIYQLQDAPAHLTDIILKISYQSTSEGYKPTGFSIVESLGTISETQWHGVKGDIHPDP